MNQTEIEAIVARVLQRIGPSSLAAPPPANREAARQPILIEASARHVHLSTAALEKLFGPGAALTKERELSQPGEFLSGQRVKVVTASGEIANVAVLGPLRESVQIELSQTDCRALGIRAPLNISGDLRNAADAVLIGDRGMIEAKGSVIVAKAHVHLRPEEAQAYGLRDGQLVNVSVESARPLTFSGIVVRVRDSFAPAVHIDFDEANACLLNADSRAFLLINGGMPQLAACAVPPQTQLNQAPCCEHTVITEEIALGMIKKSREKVVQIGGKAILTPAAKDVFSNAKITIMRI